MAGRSDIQANIVLFASITCPFPSWDIIGVQPCATTGIRSGDRVALILDVLSRERHPARLTGSRCRQQLLSDKPDGSGIVMPCEKRL